MPAVHRRPPGPPPRFLIGNFPLFDPDPLAIYTRWAREFGDIFYYRAGWMDIYFLNHPSLIESVLVSQSQNFAKDKVIQNSRWFLGEGLLTSEGSGWLRQRRLSQPAFHRERMAAYGQTMAAYTEEMLATWQDGRGPRHPSGNDAAHHAHRGQGALQRGGESRTRKGSPARSTS